MKTINALRNNVPLATVLGFTLACAVGLGFLWTRAGGTVPLVTEHRAYDVTFASTDIKNLRDLGDVKVAGVTVGRVEETSLGDDGAVVNIALDEEVAPLHEGVTVRVGVKSLVGSSYVEVVDGDGPEIEDGAALPASAVKESVDVDELFNALDAKTRANLSASLRSLDTVTRGRGQELDRLLRGAGRLGTSGHTVLDAVAAQSSELELLSREATQLLATLDTGRGQIATLVRDARTLTGALAGQRTSIEETVRQLPGLLDHVRTGAVKLEELSGPLTPIARHLRVAAPDLNRALVNLPSVTDDLHGLLPALDDSLDAAPATLDRIPPVADDLSGLVPDALATLRDLNPMLAYLAPYGRDTGAMLASFGASMDRVAEDGIRPIRLAAVFGPGSIRGVPIRVNPDDLYWTNPYPAPGAAGTGSPWRGEYPRLQREPR